MKYRINAKKGDAYSYFTKGTRITPLECNSPVIVVTDGSKTNSCVVVGTVSGRLLSYYELSGEGMDTTLFCEELEEFYYSLLKNVKVVKIGQEEIITKKTKNNVYVTQFHVANKVLTELRAHLITIARNLTGESPEEINNKRWKRRVLPDGYRSNSEKGSLRYLSSLDPMWVGVKDDVTDAMCMFLCMVTDYQNEHPIYCDCSEECTSTRDFSLTDFSFVDTNSSRKFTYNYNFSVEDNAKFFMNRAEEGGYSIIDINKIKYEDIFKHMGIMLTPESQLCLYVSES